MARLQGQKQEFENQADYRAWFDSECLRVWHLEGREKTFRITHVEPFKGEIRGPGKKAAKKQPKLALATEKGTPIELPLLLNKTNAAVIARLYGNNPFKWVGHLITLFPSTTDSPQGTVDCIRIRNQVPQGKTKAGAGAVAQSSDSRPAPAADDGPLNHERDTREPGDDDEPPPGALATDQVIQ